ENTVDSARIRLWFDEVRHEVPPGPAMPGTDARRILRKLRERVFFTLMVRDINGIASLAEVTEATSALADLAIAQAYQSVAAELAEVHGVPQDPHTRQAQEMLIIGMGKLGG